MRGRRRFDSDARSRVDQGVSEVIGFILIFGMLIISFSVYQGLIIPDQNEKAEFEHNEKAQGQMLNLHDAIHRRGRRG